MAVFASAGNLDGLVGFSFGSGQFVGLTVASFAQAADGTVIDLLTEIEANASVAGDGGAYTYAVASVADGAGQISVNVFEAGTNTYVESVTFYVVGYNANSLLVSSMSLPALIAALQAGQSVAGQIGAIAAEFPGDGASVIFNPGGSFVPCFALGTRILTALGEIAVERVRVGDPVPGQVSGKLRRVRWVGRKKVNVKQHPHPWDVAPVRIRAGALAPGRPHRDVRLSPDHAVLVDGGLIPVRYLVNDATIVQEFVDGITYLHIELDSHDVVLADGLPCESFLDTGNRDSFVAPDLGRAARPWRSPPAMIAEPPPQQQHGEPR